MVIASLAPQVAARRLQRPCVGYRLCLHDNGDEGEELAVPGKLAAAINLLPPSEIVVAALVLGGKRGTLDPVEEVEGHLQKHRKASRLDKASWSFSQNR